MKCLLSFLFILIYFQNAFSQVSSSFTCAASACLQQNIYLTNTSQNATRYEWDLCPHDFDSLNVSQTIANINGLSNYGAYAYKLVEDNGTWYGFVAQSSFSGILYRLDFGNSPLNTPTIVNLGNPGNALVDPVGFDIYKVGNNWYGFLGVFDPGGGIVRLDFGSSLTNSPSGQNLGMFGLSGRFWDVKVVEENGNLILVIPLRGSSSSIVRVNYRDSFDNSISNITDVYVSTPNSDVVLGSGLDLVQIGSDWLALVVSNSTNTIVQFRFSASIFSEPVEETIYAGSELNKPFHVKILQEGSRYVAAVTNENSNIELINFFDFSSTPVKILHGSLPPLLTLYAFKYKGNSIIQGAGTSNSVTGLIFQSICDAPFSFVEASTPSNLKYSTPGTKDIQLRAFDNQDLYSTASSQIIVGASTSPDITFTSQNNCVGNNINFASSNLSGSISNYLWDFGDSNTSSSAISSSHIYSKDSTYQVTLTVTASNSCQNSYQQSLQVFNQPQANFSLPMASPFCTNQNYVFTNTSTFDQGSNPVWQWSVNGINVSSAKDLNYLFSSTSSETILLTASIPGCSSQNSQNISSLTDGPLVNFTSPNTGCVSSSISFTNNTSGSATSFAWTYGDGNGSSQTDGSNSYASTGIYPVKLTVTNTAGCINSFVKNIPIYSNPQPNFQTELPPLSCAKSATQFDNLTPTLTDSNISTWLWSFGDGSNGTSNAKNPAYTYSLAGKYKVTLQATTNFGCSKSFQDSITIYPSPQAGFTNLPACVNQSTQFADASTGSITFYQWAIQNSVLQGSSLTTPSYTFSAAGTYPVILTVTSSNGCLSQISKNLIVPVRPTIDFTVQAPCTGHPTFFQELNPGGTDPAIAWSWNFGSSNASGPIVSYQFPSENGYSVTMNSTRQSGCVYSVLKNISIVAGPIANFTPSQFAGAAPLSVTFQNNSTADSYFWQFGDANNNTSTDLSPTFIYTTLGSYKALLTANNSYGCSDTLSTEIDVVVPRIDLVLENLSLLNDPNSNSTKAELTISNAGNIPLIDPEVDMDLGGGALVKENVTGMIRPGKSLTQTLGLQIVPQAIQYVCAIVVATGDVASDNNKQCVSLSAEDIVMDPYPNPAHSGTLHFDWICKSQETIDITIYKSNGEVAFHQTLNSISSGLNQMSIETSNLSDGLYLIQFAGPVQKTFRFVVAN